MGGTNIETQSSNVIKAQATLTIAQLIRFNCTVRRRKDTLAMYHTKEREPPLPFFVGFYYMPKLERRAWLTRCVTLDYQYLTIEFYRSLQRWVMPNAADSMQRLSVLQSSGKVFLQQALWITSTTTLAQ